MSGGGGRVGGGGGRRRPGALELVAAVLDAGTWRCWDVPVPELPPGVDAASSYARDLAAARERTGLDEAVVTGEGRIRGRRVAVVAQEFGFLGGSVGVAAAERLVVAVERATAERLPLLASPASGGTRMQEGTVAFLQMVKITAAVAAHKAAALPYLVHLRHPTTGGVLASWGSLGHITSAEPGAMIGFLGPRVYEALYGEPFPAGVQVAENLLAHGLVDAVVPAAGLPEAVERVLAVLTAPREGLPEVPELPREGLADLPAWDSIQRSRRPDRPGVRRLLTYAAEPVVPLHGTRRRGEREGLLVAVAKFGGAPCVVLGQDRRGAERDGTPPVLGPAALHEARRAMRLARDLGLPLVTVIDTPGAALSVEAEEHGLAAGIALSLAELVTLEAPTLCLLLGQGSGGAALALAPADVVVCAQHAWLSPLPPEGASAIVHRTPDRAAELAQAQGVRSLDLLRAGIVDRIVAERPDAADEPVDFCRRVGSVLQHYLVRLLEADPVERHARRLERYRRIGTI